MTATMTQPAALWTDANREEIDAENRMAEADARAEWEHNEAIRENCEDASQTLHALSVVQNWPLLTKTLTAYRGTLELMTGETWPSQLGPFLRKCALVAKGDAGMTDRELMEWVA